MWDPRMEITILPLSICACPVPILLPPSASPDKNPSAAGVSTAGQLQAQRPGAAHARPGGKGRPTRLARPGASGRCDPRGQEPAAGAPARPGTSVGASSSGEGVAATARPTLPPAGPHHTSSHTAAARAWSGRGRSTAGGCCAS
jgi:hypothetical protein